jgi:transposase
MARVAATELAGLGSRVSLESRWSGYGKSCFAGMLPGLNRPHTSNDVRARALAAVDDGKSVAEVACFSRCRPSTVRRWIRRRTTTGSAPADTRCRRPLIGPEQAEALRQQATTQPEAAVAQDWQNSTGSTVSLSTMSLPPRRLGIALKKTLLVREQSAQQRTLWRQRIPSIAVTRLILCDETSTPTTLMNCYRNRSRSARWG